MGAVRARREINIVRKMMGGDGRGGGRWSNCLVSLTAAPPPWMIDSLTDRFQHSSSSGAFLTDGSMSPNQDVAAPET